MVIKMKKALISSIFAIALIAIIIVAIALFTNQRELKKLKAEPVTLPNNFTCTAHTGCVDTEENSLHSIEAGIQHGADIVEFDLRFLADGTPVLSHDEPNGNEVTLDEAFKKVSEYDNILVNVDIKVTDNLKAVYPLAKKHGIEEQIFYTGVNAEFVDAVKKDSPEVAYYLNVSVEKPKKQTPEYLEALVAQVKESGAVGINFNKDNATRQLVDTFHENGLLVSIWTVNEEKEMYEILHLSPDNITTKRPDKMQEILK